MSVFVNGRMVDATDEAGTRLAAVRELLRQRAVASGMLAPHATDTAEVDAAIERLLQDEVAVPVPTESECRRYYDAHRAEFRSGELAFVRHILFQVTPGLPVNELRATAERTLMELRRVPEEFAARARELSNCPSGLFGGNLGQIGRGDTVAEFEAAVFAEGSLGILPRLVKTRHGFHIVAVDHRVAGETIPFEAATPRISEQLADGVQERALRQYVTLLAGEADVVGVDLAAASSPLVQ